MTDSRAGSASPIGITTPPRAAPGVAVPGGGAIAAVFDVDNTLLPGTTSERAFIAYLIRNGHYGARATFRTLLTIVRHARLGPGGALRIHRPYLRDRTVADVARLAGRVFATRILPNLSPRGLARIRWHQGRGHRVALLSGAPEFLVSLLATYLQVETVIGTPLERHAERYTGALAGLHPYGERKTLLARQFIAEQQIDARASYAYADHHTDADVLALFGHPTCVNGTTRLRAIAAQAGWAIEEWPPSTPTFAGADAGEAER